MKKLVLALTVLFSAIMVMAQNFGKAAIAIVPKADIVAFSNAEKMNTSVFAEKAKVWGKKVEQEEWYKKKAADADDDLNLEKFKVAGEKLLDTIGINKDENFAKTCVFSLAFNNFQPQGAEPDFSKLDMAFAIELVKPLTIAPVDFAKALNEFLAALDEDIKESAEIKPGIYGAVPTLSLEIKDEDIPASFQKITLAIVSPTLVLVAPEASAKAALDRAKAGTAIAVDPFFAAIKDDSYVALKMIPELAGQINNLGGNENPGFTLLASATGFALVANATDKMKVSLNAYLPSEQTATAIKTQMWDQQFAPMVEMFKPSINEQFGGSLPLLNTIKGTADGKVFGISFDVTEEDIKAFFEQQKKEFEAGAADDDDDE